MLNKIHEILKDPECSGNIKCFVWAFVVVCIYGSVLLYGFALLGFYEENIRPYERKIVHIELQIEDMISAQEQIDVEQNKMIVEQNKMLSETDRITKDHKENDIHYGRVLHTDY